MHALYLKMSYKHETSVLDHVTASEGTAKIR